MAEDMICVRKHFNTFEKELLLELTKKNLDVIENKKTNAVSIKEKQETWKKIGTEFNSIPGVTPRTSKQLWDCYKNLKKKAVKERAKNKIEIYKTGGGISDSQQTDVLGERILAMGVITEPLENQCDSNALYERRLSSIVEGTIPEVEITHHNNEHNQISEITCGDLNETETEIHSEQTSSTQSQRRKRKLNSSEETINAIRIPRAENYF